jgi:trehalose 6-phosphate phosphatase
MLFDNLDELKSRLNAKKVALFFDYDGTLTPIVEDPAAATLNPQMYARLQRVARIVPIAIVSGRDMKVLTDFVQLEGVYYAASHGFEITGPDFSSRPDEGEIKPVIESAYRALTERVAMFPGTRLELKPFSVAVHFRQADAEHLPKILDTIEHVLAAHPKLRRREGKKVSELQFALNHDKGKAVDALLQALRGRLGAVVPIYVGDDLTDEDAFDAVQRAGGLGVVVRGEEDRATRADYALRSVAEVGRFLDMFTGELA